MPSPVYPDPDMILIPAGLHRIIGAVGVLHRFYNIEGSFASGGYNVKLSHLDITGSCGYRMPVEPHFRILNIIVFNYSLFIVMYTSVH